MSATNNKSWLKRVRRWWLNHVWARCVWNVTGEGAHFGLGVTWQEIFNHQIRIPICAKCLNEHRNIMFLISQGLDRDAVVEQTNEWWEQRAKDLAKERGLRIEDTIL